MPPVYLDEKDEVVEESPAAAPEAPTPEQIRAEALAAIDAQLRAAGMALDRNGQVVRLQQEPEPSQPEAVDADEPFLDPITQSPEEFNSAFEAAVNRRVQQQVAPLLGQLQKVEALMRTQAVSGPDPAINRAREVLDDYGFAALADDPDYRAQFGQILSQVDLANTGSPEAIHMAAVLSMDAVRTTKKLKPRFTSAGVDGGAASRLAVGSRVGTARGGTRIDPDALAGLDRWPATWGAITPEEYASLQREVSNGSS